MALQADSPADRDRDSDSDRASDSLAVTDAYRVWTGSPGGVGGRRAGLSRSEL
jgi:hypothetical protein